MVGENIFKWGNIMIKLFKKIYVFLVFKYQKYKGRKDYAHKPENYTSIISANQLAITSNRELDVLRYTYYAITAKGLDDNLYYDCENGDVYTIINGNRYNLLDMVKYNKYYVYGYGEEHELEDAPFANVLDMDISLTLNPGYITVQLPDNRVKLYPLTCDIRHKFALTKVKAFRDMTPLKISEFV